MGSTIFIQFVEHSFIQRRRDLEVRADDQDKLRRYLNAIFDVGRDPPCPHGFHAAFLCVVRRFLRNQCRRCTEFDPFWRLPSEPVTIGLASAIVSSSTPRPYLPPSKLASPSANSSSDTCQLRPDNCQTTTDKWQRSAAIYQTLPYSCQHKESSSRPYKGRCPERADCWKTLVTGSFRSPVRSTSAHFTSVMPNSFHPGCGI